MMWFRLEDCLPDIERLIRIEASGGAVVFGGGAHTAPAKEMTKKEIEEKARHLILKYSQEYVKDTARYRLIFPSRPSLGVSDYAPKHCPKQLCLCQYIDKTFFTTIRVMNVLKIPSSELNLKAVLLNGQSFRWRSIEDAFYGVVEGLLLHIRRLDNEQVEWRCLGRAPRSENIDVATKLHKYFQLEVSLTELWRDWCDRDPFMTQLKDVKELHGIRILKQEPLETLLAFICSANNNIPRISSMVNKLAKLYGDPIVLDSPTQSAHVLERFPELGYAFPTLSQLVAVQDELTAVLREQQFGYRANYVSGTVRQLSDMSPDILFDVQTLPCDEIRKFLRGFSGVGPKVAECVALMSLGQNQCVPIDRHVFEITKKYFLPALKDSSLTDALNRHIMEFYEEKFGAYAGWAQAVLFNQQLEKFVHTPVITKQAKQQERTVKTKTVRRQKKTIKKNSKLKKGDSCGIPLKGS
ncbi:8-oxoguanine DNA-glycosylase [Ancylostoma caninum]|uniref:DNA-(apurinic or apyrimidinic site) lyase n=1 Tax=Ancylostoma caninum TaxID=29170 RepID=A0A368FDA4_ANCCA|nr:8-oxoguanine DNA-glycosylase [Ancylostoma caninum]